MRRGVENGYGMEGRYSKYKTSYKGMNAVSIVDVSKSFGEVKALNRICLEVETGEIFGLIGADGAGKSTLFDILVTLLCADSGSASVNGLDVRTSYRALRPLIGYMPGRFSLYSDLTVVENLRFFAQIFGTSLDAGEELIRDIWVQIEPFKDRLAGKLSGGMKQKLALCCALVHEPKVLFLDEPTTGVDPVSRREFWEMLKRLKTRGITIVVSTPYMDEAVLCDRVALMQRGTVMTVDTPAAIIAGYGKPLYAVEYANVYRLLLVLRQFRGMHSCYTFGRCVHLTLKEDADGGSELSEYLSENGLSEFVITPIEATIEDCFMELSVEGKSRVTNR